MSDSENDKRRRKRHSSEEQPRKKRKSRRASDSERDERDRRARSPSPRDERKRRNDDSERAIRRGEGSSREHRRRDRSISPGSRKPVADRYWGSRNSERNAENTEPSNDRYALGARYYSKTEPEEVKPEPPPRKPQGDMLNTRTGGAYIPPARLRLMQAQITDKSTPAYQRIAWEALKKSIHGHINKINVGNIGIIIKQLLKENIVRGRGLLCRSIIQAQAASPTFTNVYAALVAAVNSRFPNVGELLLKRLIIQFKRGFKRNDKPICISAATFIAHLVNQTVAHEILALELLTLLVETPTDDSVEVSIAFLKECGLKLTKVSPKGVNTIFELLRHILHEGALDKRVQYMIEVMFQVWKDGFKDHPAVIEELELVPEEEQFTHLMMLDEATDPQDLLNVFKLDDKYEENEQKYRDLAKDILGSDADTDQEGSGSGSGSDDSDDEEEEEKKDVTIIDNTETNLIALRRTIYLTINSSLDFEECAHKLMKMQLKPGQEIELCHMFLDCCAEQRTYEKFYGLLAQRFCQINKIYILPFEEIFKDSYETAHRLDTNRLRNVSKFFAHLLFTDSISWEVLECVKLNEEDTTSSSRIYIKILFQELAEYMGLKKLNDRLRDPTLQEAFQGLFPRDNPKNTRFSINFFTSIGLGGLTDDLREHLKQLPKNVPQQITEINVSGTSDSSDSDSSSSSSSSDSSSSSSSDSDSEDDQRKSKKKKNSEKDTNKTKETSPTRDERNKENDRWGHDGFYDTYGKDAVRNTNVEQRRRGYDERDRRVRDFSTDMRRNDSDTTESRRKEATSRHREESDRRYKTDGRTNKEDTTGSRDKNKNRDEEQSRNYSTRNPRKEAANDDRRYKRDRSREKENEERKDDHRRRNRQEIDDSSQKLDSESSKRRDKDRSRDRAEKKRDRLFSPAERKERRVR